MQKIYIVFYTLIGLITFKSFASNKCDHIRFSNIGWTDTTATTAVASEILKALGYKTKSIDLSVPMTYASLKNNDIDIFLGNWMPGMAADILPYQKQGSVETIGTLLQGARYTLAVPSYVFEAGVKSFDDLAKFKQKFHGKILGVEAGNDANRRIQEIIKDNAHQLKGWKIIESSEQAMLMEVIKSVKRQNWIVFLGWEPHPMNRLIKMNYLSGGEKYFGSNFGESTVYINSRKNYSKECPEIAKFFKKFNFSIQDENELMNMIWEKKIDPSIAAKTWIKTNPSKVEEWLTDLKQHNGEMANYNVVKNKL